MTLDAMLHRLLENIPGADFSDFIAEANAREAAICLRMKHRWSWLLTSEDVLCGVDDSGYFDLPSDCAALYAIVNEDTGVPLNEVVASDLMLHKQKQSCCGTRFSVIGTTYKLIDSVSDGTSLRIWYYRRLGEMDSITDTPSLPEHLHELLYNGLLLTYMERHLGERENSQARISRQASKYNQMLEAEVIADTNRSKPNLRMQRKLF